MWRVVVFMVLCLAPDPSNEQLTLQRATCDASRRKADIQLSGANVILGGLFAISEAGTKGQGCGLPSKELMQAYEAARWFITYLNSVGYVSNVKFGMQAFDTCTLEGNALRSLETFYPKATSAQSYCVLQSTPYKLGLVGPMTAWESESVATWAADIPASVVSMRSAAPGLSNKNLYPTFLRTDQSSSIYARALASLLQSLQWEKIVIIYTDDSYGMGGYTQILQAVYEAGICVAAAVSVPHDGTVEDHRVKLTNIGSFDTTAAVYYGATSDAVTTLQALQTVSNINTMKWVFGQLDLQVDISSYTAGQGAIVGLSSFVTIDEFRDYFINLNENNPSPENPWYKDWYMNVFQCRLTGVNYDPYRNLPSCIQQTTIQRQAAFRQSQYVETTINAIMAYAETIRNICGSGLCSQLTTMSPSAFHAQLKAISFTYPNTFSISALRGRRIAFDLNGDPVVAGYTFYNFNNRSGTYSFEQFATYSSGNLQLSATPIFNKKTNTVPAASFCPSTGCTSCLHTVQDVTLLYKPGDIVIAVLVNAHESDAGGLGCGKAIPDQLIDAVAARYAAATAAAVSGLSTRKVSMGYLIVDVCPGREAAESFLSNLLGSFKLYVNEQGIIINPSNIVAFIDITDGNTAAGVSPILAKMGIPEIRIISTSTSDLQSKMFPLLSSAVPSEEVVHIAVAEMLSSLQWSYVQIISDANGSYYRAAENFRKVARGLNICVALWSVFSEDLSTTVSRMIQLKSAPVVVVFGNSLRLRSLLAQLRAARAQNTLTLVSGNEVWGASQDFTGEYFSDAAGSLTVKLAATDDAGFSSSLQRATFDDISADVFLTEWFQQKFDCAISSASRGRYNRTCTSSDKVSSFYQSYAPYIISTVKNVAVAVNSMLQSVCPNTNGICSGFRTSSPGQQIADYIRNAQGMSNLEFYNIRNGTYQSVGQFDSVDRRIQSMSPTTIVTATGALTSTIASCVGRCLECQYAYLYQDFAFTPGDWLVAGTFSISQSGREGQRPYVCGDIRTTNGFLYSAAMMYAIERINSGSAPIKLRNITLGGIAMDHCNNERRAFGQVSDVYSGLMQMVWQQDMQENLLGGGQQFAPNHILAWLTDNTASSKEAGEILQPLKVPIVSPSATSSSLMDNPIFFRTIQGDDAIALAIVRICKQLGVSYIQVINSADDYGRAGLATLTSVARREKVCIVSSAELVSSSDAANVARIVSLSTTKVVVLYMGTTLTTAFLQAAAQLPSNQRLTLISPEPFTDIVTNIGSTLTNMISLQQRNSTLSDFNAFLNSLDAQSNNPFFARYYMKMLNCNLPGYYIYARDCDSALQPLSYSQGGYVLSTVNAVYAVAAALDMTLKEFCGQTYYTMCSNFLQSASTKDRFVENLKVVSFMDPSNFNFMFLEREGNVIYDVLRFSGTGYNIVGSYGSSSLTLIDGVATYYKGVQSSCGDNCAVCVFNDLTFSYTAGDIYLGGVFDVHAHGQGVFDCGSINLLHGFQLLEAFHFAIQQVNKKQGIFANILNGVQLGGIGLDACESPINTGFIVSNINNGLNTLVWNGKVIKPEDIDIYVGPYSSDSAISLARILTQLQIPQISYAATSTTLQDTRIFPYFYRTVQADDKQALAMLKYLDQRNVRYVQLLYTETSYGKQAVAQFELMIKKYAFRICVAQKTVFPETGITSDESSNKVVSSLLGKPLASTVVIFAGTKYIKAFLKAVARNPGAVHAFKFLGPTTWGNYPDVTQELADVASDAVTLMVDFKSLKDFEDYMIQRRPGNAYNNPWFEEWFQTVLKCYTTSDNADIYSRACSVDEPLSAAFSEDYGALHVINAVYAAAFAIDATLKFKCGEGYSAVCEAYRNSRSRRADISNNLASVNFTDMTSEPFKFVDREGNKGYILYKAVRTSLVTTQNYNYLQIGKYDNNGNLSLNTDLASSYDGTCTRPDTCAECPNIRNRGVRYALGGDLQGDVTLIGVFNVHNQGTEPYQCGTINMDGFQQFLAFFNAFTTVAQSSRIRLLALDSCSNSMRVGQDLFGILSPDEAICNSDFNVDNLGLGRVGGVLVTGQDNALAASRILEPLQVSFVNPDALTLLLDDQKFLARTITPESARFCILSKFLKFKGWSYINTIHLGIGEGNKYYSVFLQKSQNTSICISSKQQIPDGATDDNIRASLRNLPADQGARVIVLFTSIDLTVRILQLAQDLDISRNYLWVFALEYPDQIQTLPSGLSFRAVILQPVTREVTSFNDYLSTMTYNASLAERNRAQIPRIWFEDFYQAYFTCRLSGAVYPLDYQQECSLDNKINKDTFVQNRFILNTVAASYTLGTGVSSVLKGCNTGETLEACLKRRSLTRQALFDEVLKTTWMISDDSSKKFNITPDSPLTMKFNSMRYWDTDYDIVIWNVENGLIQERQMWRWSGDNATFTITGAGDSLQDFTSVCLSDTGCSCQQAMPDSQAQTGKSVGPTQLRNYYESDSPNKKKYEWPIWAITVAVLTSVGLLITLIVFVYLLIFYPVYGGTSVLGFMTMIGIMGIYAINFAFFVHASEATCGARRFVMGVVYSIVFGALLVKAVDNWRFSDNEYGKRKYRGLTNSVTLFLFAVGIVLVQCIIPIEWLILVHPTAHKWTDSVVHDYWWCDPYDVYDYGLVCSFIFVMFLVLLTGIFAALAWDSDNNNQESRWILAGSIITAGCFLVWMIVSTNAGPVYRDPAVAIGNLVNATLLLICIPLRKLHLLCQSKKEKPEPQDDAYQYDNNTYMNHSFDPDYDGYGYNGKQDDSF